MILDSYGEVINHYNNFEEIARALSSGVGVMIGWTDNAGSHFDIMFNYRRIVQMGNIQGGVKPMTDLMVSVMRRGAFGFEVNNQATHHSYFAEKLNMGGHLTERRLEELINGVRKELLAINKPI